MSNPELVSVVIENGSSSTRAGFSNEQLPSLIVPTIYSTSKIDENYIIGDNIDEYPDNDIYTILNDGVVYNWDALEKNWGYIFDNLSANSEELPLVITEELWNNKKNRQKLAELAFETFKVPVFSIIKSPVAVTYGLGRSSSLVLDIGSSTTSVTPILDGTILYKGAIHSKFAGDFLNLHSLNYLNKFKPIEETFFTKGSDSFRKYQTNGLIHDFKSTILSVSPYPIVDSNAEFNIAKKNYQLPDGEVLEISKEQVLIPESLFHPLSYNLPGIELPKESLGLTDLILSSLKKLDLQKHGYDSLLGNLIITGSASSLPGLESRILNDMKRLTPGYNIHTYTNPNVLERSNSVWLGASVLSSLNNFENQYISKAEFEESGEEAVNQKFK
ncbi:hypothetical protein WICMUC_004894 [Wickerhamomyces mucosus]|uniref:Actin n=1 Tax=Wickerhamomyces mucosus TaxID=1378264 RepID=A0A9P8T9I9_9ASCO|nr:hypothetical protein WICMUC_004894 [Wickerhamomyces mucosus]